MVQAHEQRRQRASDRYLAGDPIEDICREWAGSKRWLDTWRERSLAPDPSWSAARSRRPSTTPPQPPQRIAPVVVALRQLLAQQGKDWGAAALQQALAQQGREPVPSQRTISRMLHRYTKEVIDTNPHQPCLEQRGKVLPGLPWRPRPGTMAT